MKIYVKLDKGSIPASLRAVIKSANTNLSHSDDDIYLYTFNPLEFTHAWLLLGSYPSRYGSDLSPYLANTKDFFKRAPASPFLNLDFGSEDFKRKLSEDLGASLASLLMVESFHIEWQTIAQIPKNRTLSKNTPDFEGFTFEGDRYIYEAKGRTNPKSVIPAIEKANSQVKAYPEPAVRKLAIVSYFASDNRAFPSYAFILDPPMPDIIPPDKEHSILLHYIKVFDFIGFTQTKKTFTDFLRAKFTLESSEAESPSKAKWEKKIFSTKQKFDTSYSSERENVERITYNEQSFIGRRLEAFVENEIYTFFCGINEALLNNFCRDMSVKELPKNTLDFGDEIKTSIFSDGTILQMRKAK